LFDHDFELKSTDSHSIVGSDDPFRYNPLVVQERPGFALEVAQSNFAIIHGDLAVMRTDDVAGTPHVAIAGRPNDEAGLRDRDFEPCALATFAFQFALYDLQFYIHLSTSFSTSRSEPLFTSHCWLRRLADLLIRARSVFHATDK
jgi:hypothetical protein